MNFSASAIRPGDKASTRPTWLPPEVLALAAREQEVARIVYEQGACTAFDVEGQLSDKLANASVRKMLVRLTDKGILRRETSPRGRGQKCVYVPAIGIELVREKAIAEVASRHFQGSLLSMALKAVEMIEPGSTCEGRIIQTLEQSIAASQAPRTGSQAPRRYRQGR